MFKFTLKYLISTPSCFGPFRPSSGSLHWAWLKYVKVCTGCCAVLHAAQHPVHTPQPETHAATTPRYL